MSEQADPGLSDEKTVTKFGHCSFEAAMSEWLVLWMRTNSILVQSPSVGRNQSNAYFASAILLGVCKKSVCQVWLG